MAGSTGHAEQAPNDFARLLEEAIALVREDQLTEATTRLQTALGLLERQRILRRRRADFADGCLELGFSYLGLGERQSARDAFECTLILDRKRRLDPQIYAAPAVAVFDEARAAIEARSPRKP